MDELRQLITQGLLGSWDIIELGAEHAAHPTIELRQNGSFSLWWDETGVQAEGALLVPTGNWRVVDGPAVQLMNFELPPTALIALPRIWRIVESADNTRKMVTPGAKVYMWHRRS